MTKFLENIKEFLKMSTKSRGIFSRLVSVASSNEDPSEEDALADEEFKPERRTSVRFSVSRVHEVHLPSIRKKVRGFLKYFKLLLESTFYDSWRLTGQTDISVISSN